MIDTRPVQDLLDAAVRDGVFPGAVVHVRQRGAVVVDCVAGRLTADTTAPSVTADTLYDLASLTKPLATTWLVFRAVSQGRLDLYATLDGIFPELNQSAVGRVTIRQLLCHAAGLPGWRPYYERLVSCGIHADYEAARKKAAAQVLAWIAVEPLASAPGTESVYSDLGFMLLGWIVERIEGKLLVAVWRDAMGAANIPGAIDFLARPESVTDRFGVSVQVAPTEQDPFRGRLLCGNVHDENAWALGGVAGHAGLFGTAAAVGAMGQWWLDGRLNDDTGSASNLFRLFTSRVTDVPGSSRALGWDTPSAPSSSGRFFSAESFGHLGFTGTSLWIDPWRELVVALVSNRVHPTRQNERIKTFRPRMHDEVIRCCDSAG
ncbi:MAG: serine hydrolase domain-containing protein [Nitrospiraceae bacterium]